ncbi:hypothetical protein FQA39_LY02094 [Lamprigera yunnana]|nr:hypothetical protein FQA39_LY02094 [Lamprigera yunnana]
MSVVHKIALFFCIIVPSNGYVPYNHKPEMCLDLSLYALNCLDTNLYLLNTTSVKKSCNELSNLFGFFCIVPKDVPTVYNQVECLISLSETLNVWKQMVTVHYVNKVLQEHPKTKACMCNYFSYLSKCRI